MAILIPIAFAAGLITAFSPCVLPVLPIILAGGGAAETRRRPYAIVAGLVVTFTAFVLAGSWLWGLIGVSAKDQLKIGAVMLLVLAFVLIVPKVGEWLERPFLFLTRRPAGDLGGGFLLGASLGLVFVPCSGPVLAAVVANVGSHRVGADTVVLALVYALGVAVPLLLVAHGSRRVTLAFRQHARGIRIGAGVVIAVMAVVLYQNWAQSLQTNIPGYVGSLQGRIEGSNAATSRLARLQGRSRVELGSTDAAKAPQLATSSALAKVPLGDYGTAPNFQGIAHWLNTPGDKPLSISDLHGKVVLVDFWTYSCINCLRTLPHLEEWEKEYGPKGFEIVGVHTPEFAFEHDYGNVNAAVRRLHVDYPVAMDNDYDTWNAYLNQYWPAEYLIDQTGQVRHIQFGEGDYGGTERDIRLLLAAGGESSLPTPVSIANRTPTGLITPESYLGTERIERYAGSPIDSSAAATYHFPKQPLPQDDFAYAGRWSVQGQRIVAGDGAKLRFHFHAANVYLVLGGKGFVTVKVDGQSKGAIHVTRDRLYTLVSTPEIEDGILDLAFTPGVQAYAFTFG